MIVRLREAEVGDRFVADTGVAWTVMSNQGGYVTLIAAHQQPYSGWPPPDMEVEVTNRDDSLTVGGALTNLNAAGIAGRVIGVE